MRLTLRTLLAYMDDILDPADHEELARKIEASPFATELIHRSRDAIRRLRLSAPDVLAGDSGDVHGGDGNMDANRAAEYLDSLLSPEEIADFERSCLEAGPHADMLLAEAVSCHHILTLVLGEPAEVDADLRQRMYALADEQAAAEQVRIEPAHTPNHAEVVHAAPAAAVAPAPRRSQVEADEASVPDYILEAARARRRKQRMVLSICMAAVFGGLATWFFWPQGEVKVPSEMAAMGDVDSFIQGADVGDDAPAAVESGDMTVDAGDDAPAWSPSTAETEAPSFADEPAADMPASDAPAVEPTTDASSPLTPATESADVDGSLAASTPVLVEPAESVDLTATPPAPPSDDPATDATPDSTSTPPPAPAAPTDATANVTPPQSSPQLPPQDLPAADAAPTTAPDASAAAAPAAAPDDASAAGAAAPAEEGPKQIGAYLGNNDLLLRFDPASESWIRLAPRSALAPGDRLLALPNFRTHAVLADANAYLGGGTEIDLAAPEAGGAGEPTADINLVMPYGRLIINSGLNGNRVRLTMGDETRTLALGSSSSLAVEVKRAFQPGADPERDSAPLAVSWYLTSGTAVPDDSLDGAEIQGPAAWTTADGADQPPQAIDKLPEWIDREPVSDSQRRALEPVAEALAPGSPVGLRLAELSDPSNLGRRIEVRSLAADASAYVGEYGPLVKTLSDVNQKAAWKNRIEALREAIARDGAPAVAGIREAFAVQRGEEQADDLMEMLVGFDAQAVGATRAEVQNGALVRLLDWLKNDDLTYRVLALHNINEITGTSSLGGYRPEHTADQRRREIKYYWDRLEKGELMPKE